jgi:hypothetical protein
MKHILFLTCLFYAALINQSCKKSFDAAAVPATADNAVTAADCERNWAGIREGTSHFPDTIGEQRLIKNGVASVIARSWSYAYKVRYPVPACKSIDAGNVRLEARIRNTDTGTISSFPFATVGIGFEYGNNILSCNFSSDTLVLHFTYIRVGDHIQWNVPELIHYFEDYSTIAIETKNGMLNIYRDAVLLTSVKIPAGSGSYNIKSLDFVFQNQQGESGGTIDWVKLYNSQTGLQLMQEDFNTDGQGSVVWFF